MPMRCDFPTKNSGTELHQFPFNLSLHHSLSLYSIYLPRSRMCIIWIFILSLFVWRSIYFKHVFHVIKFYNLLALQFTCYISLLCVVVMLLYLMLYSFLTILFTYQLCIIMGIYCPGRKQYQIYLVCVWLASWFVVQHYYYVVVVFYFFSLASCCFRSNIDSIIFLRSSVILACLCPLNEVFG